MQIHKEDVLSVFKHIIIKPEWYDNHGSKRWGFALTFYGEPKTNDEEDYFVTPMGYLWEATPEPIEDAWEMLCIAATDTKLPMIMSDTYLDIDTEFICIIPEYDGWYGMTVINPKREINDVKEVALNE
jgi:hypothetical protein